MLYHLFTLKEETMFPGAVPWEFPPLLGPLRDPLERKDMTVEKLSQRSCRDYIHTRQKPIYNTGCYWEAVQGEWDNSTRPPTREVFRESRRWTLMMDAYGLELILENSRGELVSTYTRDYDIPDQATAINIMRAVRYQPTDYKLLIAIFGLEEWKE